MRWQTLGILKMRTASYTIGQRIETKERKLVSVGNLSKQQRITTYAWRGVLLLGER